MSELCAGGGSLSGLISNDPLVMKGKDVVTATCGVGSDNLEFWELTSSVTNADSDGLRPRDEDFCSLLTAVESSARHLGNMSVTTNTPATKAGTMITTVDLVLTIAINSCQADQTKYLVSGSPLFCRFLFVTQLPKVNGCGGQESVTSRAKTSSLASCMSNSGFCRRDYSSSTD